MLGIWCTALSTSPAEARLGGLYEKRPSVVSSTVQMMSCGREAVYQ